MAHTRGKRLFSDKFNISQPLVGRGVVMRGYNQATQTGNILVRAVRTDDRVVNMYCSVGLKTAPLTLQANINPAAIPGGVVQLGQVNTSDTFQSANVQVTGIPPAVVLDVNNRQQTNQRIIIGSYDASGTKLEDVIFDFIAVPAVATVNVSARGCLFFAYAPVNSTSLPNVGEALPNNYPTAVTVPMDFTNVVLQLVGRAQTWTDDNGVAVPADGQGGIAAVSTNANLYVSKNLNSSSMTILPAPALDGMLAGMWDIGRENCGAGTTIRAGQELALGTGLGGGVASAPITRPDFGSAPISVFNLLLGMHQASNWSLQPDDTALAPNHLTLTLSWSTTVNNYSLAFNGGGTVTFSDAGLPSGSASRSVSFWIRTSSTAATGFTFSYGSSAGWWGTLLYDPSGTMTFAIGGGSGLAQSAQAQSAEGPVNNGNWHHVVFAWSTANGNTFFLDGQQVATTLNNTPSTSLSQGAMGAIFGNVPPIGNMTDVRFYSADIGSSAGALHAAGPFAANTVGNLVSWWQFTDGPGSPTLGDSTGGRTGTLSASGVAWSTDIPT